MDKVSKRIAEIRKSKGLTQRQICDIIGMAQNNYSKIETGLTELTVNHLYKIADALGVSVVSLIDPDAQSKDYFQELNSKIESLLKTINEKEEFIQLQKQNISYIKNSIAMGLAMAEEKALDLLLDEADKLTALQAVVKGITLTSRSYLGLLQALEIISQKEIDLFYETEKKQFNPDFRKASSVVNEPKAHQKPI